jgi:hypothetical protein
LATYAVHCRDAKLEGLDKYPDAPWCRYIYLQNWVIYDIYGVNVGKYSSTMEHLSYVGHCFIKCGYTNEKIITDMGKIT